MNKPLAAEIFADSSATPITEDEPVARGGRRIVAYSLEPPRKPERSRQQRHREKLAAEDGLKQLVVFAAEDEEIRACLRGLGRATTLPAMADALRVLGEGQEDAEILAIVTRLADADFRAAVARLAAGSGANPTDAAASQTAEPPPSAVRDCEARVMRRIGSLPDEQVEAVAIAAAPEDPRIRMLALQTRADRKLMSRVHAFAKLAPERRQSLLEVDERTLLTAQTIATSSDLDELMRALSKDKRLLRLARAHAGLGKGEQSSQPPSRSWLSWLPFR